MPNVALLEKYADLAVRVGIAVKPGQKVVINSPIDAAQFTQHLVKKAYEAGASYVMVQWSDPVSGRTTMLNASAEVLEEVPEWNVQRAHYLIDQGFALISVTSPVPENLAGVEPQKLQRMGRASHQKMSFFQTHMMAHRTQWTIVGVPNAAWATKVFPGLAVDVAIEKLWNAILQASRVEADKDAVATWQVHMDRLAAQNKMLNDYNFASLHFQNGLGTDIVVGLVEDHIWAGGGEDTPAGHHFAPNIPTEESFTMPSKFNVNGTVVATKPLDYQGVIIDGFKLTFKDGKVVAYEAQKAQDNLKSLLELDEGASRIGEIALIPHDSPISNMNVLFFNTLYDENASCHMALGRAYPTNIKDGDTLSPEELAAKGSNFSMTHVDFMFGSADMSIDGITKDGKRVPLFRKGNFVQ